MRLVMLLMMMLVVLMLMLLIVILIAAIATMHRIPSHHGQLYWIVSLLLANPTFMLSSTDVVRSTKTTHCLLIMSHNPLHKSVMPK